MSSTMAADRDRVTVPKTRFRREADIQLDIDNYLKALRSGAKLALNLGCGEHPIDGVVNCDLHNPKADVATSITQLPMFEDGSADLIEVHHAIEHLALCEVVPALTEWRRVLRSSGVLVITCPDLDEVARLWLKGSQELESYTMKMLFGSQEHPGMFHKSGYSGKSLTDLVRKVGYSAELTYTPYPKRQTPSLLVVAIKK